MDRRSARVEQGARSWCEERRLPDAKDCERREPLCEREDGGDAAALRAAWALEFPRPIPCAAETRTAKAAVVWRSLCVTRDANGAVLTRSYSATTSDGTEQESAVWLRLDGGVEREATSCDTGHH
ncbi:MAG TPA: hypothetical protein VGI39_33370 [Polyangiaceae bacterium]